MACGISNMRIRFRENYDVPGSVKYEELKKTIDRYLILYTNDYSGGVSMYCDCCGNVIEAGVSFCPYCGARVESNGDRDDQLLHPKADYRLNVESQHRFAGVSGLMDNHLCMPIKWHKFLTWFGLWAAAVICLLTSISVLSVSRYSQYGWSFYELDVIVSRLRAADIAYGLVDIALAILYFYTVILLRKYRIRGLMLLTVAYIVRLLSAVLYFFITWIVVTVPFVLVDNPGIVLWHIILPIVMIFVNMAYYRKRAHLFVN